jgi:toxin ParE1/3/4
MIDIRTAARRDLDRIADYGLSTYGTDAAIAYQRGLNRLFLSLHSEPGMGRRESLGEGVRSFPYKAHRVFYRMEGDTLVILRVLSPRQETPDQV